LWSKKSSLIKSAFCEVDLKKNWCLVKTVVEIVVLKKAVSCVWLKYCGRNCGRKKSNFVFGKTVVKKKYVLVFC
jgi:hypothetical protein